MMMKKRIIVASGALITACLGVGGAYAYYQDSVTVQNHISTGDVNIGIQEYQRINGEEAVYDTTENRIVLPSEEISKIPRITNYAQPCYIRAKVTHSTDPAVSDFDTEANMETGSEKETYALTDNDISGISEQWIRKGEYYYYTEPLEYGESVDLFSGVTIPAEWTEASSGASLALTVTAEAIQAANFTPDFQSESPWGDEEIELCVHEQNNAITEVSREYQSMSVVYEGAARNLVAVPEDFFSNLGTAMPGDTLGDSVSVRNTTETEAEFFFRTEVPAELTDEERDLMEQFSLEITQEGRLVYSGGLDGKELEGAWVSLGVYQPGEEGEIHFTLQLPSELKNVYAQRETFVNWMFSVQGEEPVTETGGPVIQQLAAPKTGLKDPAVSVPLLLAAISGISTWILCRREKCHGMEK